MDLTLINSAIVLLANQHNPTLLHPYFLRKESIVPETWEWDNDSLISSPPFAQVQFKNRITITSEPQKFQVLHEVPPTDGSKSEMPGLVARYIEKVPHVQYKAVGVNFAAVVEKDDVLAFFKSAFLKPAAGKIQMHPLKMAGLTFGFRVDDQTRLTLKLDMGKSRVLDREIFGIIVHANYHHEANTNEDAKAFACSFPLIQKEFLVVINQVLKAGGSKNDS